MNGNKSTSMDTIEQDVYSHKTEAYLYYLKTLKKNQKKQLEKKGNWLSFFKIVSIIGICSTTIFFTLFV